MSFNGFNFRITGNCFSKESMRKVRQIAELIYLASPSDSNLYIEVEPVDEGVRAAARVVSASGFHECCAHDKDPVEAVAMLREKMNEYFRFWRKNRNLNETYAG